MTHEPAKLSDDELQQIYASWNPGDGRRLLGHIAWKDSELAAATAENERLRQRLLTAAGDDLCRLTQEEIKDLAGGKVPIPPKAEFLASCERFHSQIAGENGVDQNCLTLAQLVAENERLTRELEEAKDMLANWVTSCVYCGEEWTCSEDTYESSCVEHDKICEKHPLREVERELAAAQKRLAALAVDPTDEEELVAKCYELFQGSYIEKSEAPPKWDGWSPWFRGGFTAAVEGAFMVGLIAPDPDRASLPEVSELQRQLDAANKRLAELRGPEVLSMEHGTNCGYFDSESGCTCGLEWRKALQTEREMHNAWRKRAEEAEKRLAELTMYQEACGHLSDLTDLYLHYVGLGNKAVSRGDAENDRLAAELATAKQELAAARGDVERLRNPVAIAVSEAIDEGLARGPSPSPAKAAASEPVGLCPKCGIQPLTKEGDDMIRLGEKDYLCGNCKRYLCRPIESKGAASEPGDSSHTVETAHASSSQIAPADHSGEANEKVEPAERRFVCPECEGTLFSTDMEGILYCQTMSVLGACGWSGTWTEVEAAKGEGGDRFRARIYDKLCKRLGKEAADALITESDAAVAEFETAVAMIEKYGYVVMSDSQQGILEQRLAAANQAREAERQKREQAEAAAGVMKTALTNGDELNLNNNRGVSIYDALRRLRDGSMATPDNSWFGWAFDRIDKALATAPGRAADELRAGKALAGKIRDALCSVEAIAHVERALADYDQALAQGEQRGEGQHGR